MMWNIVAPSRGTSPLSQTTEDGIVLHEKVQPLPGLPLGPFARRTDGAIVAVDEKRVISSTDEGRSWQTLADNPVGAGADIRVERAILHIKRGARETNTPVGDDGVLILA